MPTLIKCRACPRQFHPRKPRQTCGYCGACLRLRRTLGRPVPTDPLERLDPDVRVVDCARCGRHLAAPGQPPCELEEVAGRVYGRPVCRRCLPAARREPMPAENRFLAQVTQEG